MDYIIFGTGSSATLILIGWLIRDWGPRLRDRKPAEEEVLSASDLVTRMAWARFCASGGMAILICGVLIMLATLAAALFAPTDRSATIAVLSTFGLAAVLMLIWTGLYLRQFGTMGVLRPRPQREKQEAPAATVTEPSEIGPASAAGIGDRDDETAAAPSFAETTASRGGLGRFAPFFRRETIEAPVVHVDEWADDPETDPDWAPEAVKSGPADEAQPTSPTDAVIAELSGDAGGADDKKLAIDDPLVTSVRRDAGAKLAEDPETAPTAAHAEPVNGGASAPDEATSPDETSSPESAIDQLRRRRMSRLAHPIEPD